MRYRVQNEGPVTRILVEGEIGVANRRELQVAAAMALDLPRVETLVLDLTAVTAADPATLAWLSSTATRARERGAAPLVLVGHGRVAQLLRASGLETTLRVVEDGRSASPPQE